MSIDRYTATADGPGSPGTMPHAILAYWQHGSTYFIPNRPAPAFPIPGRNRSRSPTSRQVVKLAVLHPSQECADFGTGIHQGGAGRVARVAHGNLAVRECRYLDTVPARVAPPALSPGNPAVDRLAFRCWRASFFVSLVTSGTRDTSGGTQMTSLPAPCTCTLQLQRQVTRGNMGHRRYRLHSVRKTAAHSENGLSRYLRAPPPRRPGRLSMETIFIVETLHSQSTEQGKFPRRKKFPR
jgi:hypothetical protein